MVISGLNVVAKARLPQGVDYVAYSTWVAPAPDQLNALIALPLIERLSAQFFGD
jgi:hypothetical protein